MQRSRRSRGQEPALVSDPLSKLAGELLRRRHALGKLILVIEELAKIAATESDRCELIAERLWDAAERSALKRCK
jgi:hypothetical protein